MDALGGDDLSLHHGIFGNPVSFKRDFNCFAKFSCHQFTNSAAFQIRSGRSVDGSDEVARLQPGQIGRLARHGGHDKNTLAGHRFKVDSNAAEFAFKVLVERFEGVASNEARMAVEAFKHSLHRGFEQLVRGHTVKCFVFDDVDRFGKQIGVPIFHRDAITCVAN